MNRIKIMSEALANKIAAGEVIERPAAVVKELVENALDAESKRIHIEVEEGGIKRIQVTDDGLGMSRSDSRLAFERHATSKLHSERDLFRINSLGFRGEALASIKAVANVNLWTWDGEEPQGTFLKVEEGKIVEVEDAPLRRGTRIEVMDLFYNTPARYKYLKSIATELSHITDIIHRLALARPDVAFTLSHNGRQLLATAGNGDQLAVLANIYGHQVARNMIPFQGEHIDFSVSGFLSRPEITRSNRQFMTVIINGRYVRHHPLHQTILRAYRTLLPVNRYPLVLLNIKLDPRLVDVNVHPAKLEIRLSKEGELLTWLEEVLKKALLGEPLIPHPLSAPKGRRTLAGKPKSVQGSFDLRLPTSHWQKGADYLTKEKQMKQIFHLEEPTRPYAPEERTERDEEGTPQSLPPAVELEQSSSEGERGVFDEEAAQEGQSPLPLLSPLGQLHGTYILAQSEEGLYMIDQHAAQERIWYEHFLEKLNQEEQSVQMLAVPLVLEFTAAEALLIEQRLEIFKQLGLIVEHFGHHAYMVRAYPVWFPKEEAESFLREVIHHLLTHQGKLDWTVLRDDLAKMACKKAIKANRYLTKQEMEALLEDLRRCQNPYTCPHGRPITVLLSKYEIEKMFKRVM